MAKKPTHEELEQRVKELEKGAIERKQLEESLREEKEFATSLIDNTPIFFVAIDAQGKTLRMNQNLLKVLGYMTNEVVGKNYLSNFVPERDRDMLASVFRKLTSEQEHTLNENHILSKDGKEFLVEWYGTPVFDTSSKLQYFYGLGINITERKKAEEALRESEERHRLLLEVSPDPIVVYGIEGKTIYVNPAFEQTFGWSLDELRDKRIDFVPEENWPETKEAINRMLQGLKIQLFETRRLTKDGRILDIQLSSSLIFDRNEKPAGNIVILRDITVQKRAEKTLRNAHDELEQRVEERTAELVLINENLQQEIVDRQHVEAELKRKITELNSFINNVPDMAWLKDSESRFIAVNKTFGEAVGMNPGSLINQTCEVCFGKEEAKKFREDDQEVMKGKKQITIVENIKDSKNNEEIWLETIKSPIFNESGKVSGTVGIARDITHRELTEKKLRESEENFRTLAENASDGILIVAGDGFHVYANRHASEITGYSISELLKTTIKDLAHPDEFEKIIERYRTILSGKPFHRKYETMIVHKDGKDVPVEVTSAKSTWHGQSADIVIIRDIAERKLSEKALMESEKRYRAVVESQTEMICCFFPDGTLTFVNEAYCRYFGKSRNELIGQNFVYLIPEDDRKKVLINLLSLNQNEPIMTHEHRVVNPNGEICWHRWTNRAIFDDQNKLMEFQSVGWDISERVWAEKDLKESEEKFKEIFERSRDAIFIASTDALFVKVNEAACHLTGYSMQELLTMSIPDLHEEKDLHAFHEFFESIIAGEPVTSEAKILRKDGSKVGTEFSNTRIFIGETAYMHTTARDITKRKQTEKELQKAHDELENRETERTRELKIQKSNLEEANISLQVLLEKMQEDKKEIADNVLTNAKELIVPYIEKIRKTKLDDQQKAFLSIMGYNINEITSPFTRKMSLKYLNLTPTEIQVANLIRHGSNSKEIADLLGLSPRTIYNHRRNIRKKFGIENKKTNLRSHLLSVY